MNTRPLPPGVPSFLDMLRQLELQTGGRVLAWLPGHHGLGWRDEWGMLHQRPLPAPRTNPPPKLTFDLQINSGTFGATKWRYVSEHTMQGMYASRYFRDGVSVHTLNPCGVLPDLDAPSLSKVLLHLYQCVPQGYKTTVYNCFVSDFVQLPLDYTYI